MRRNTRRLPALLLVILLFLGMLPATALAANFPSKFYAHLMNNSGMGTVSSSLNYTSKNTEAQQVHGMEYAGGAFFTVVGNKDDDGWRELRMYNSNLTNYRTIGTVNEKGGGYWIVDTAMDLSGEAPALYGTYNSAYELPDGSLMAFSIICSIDLTDGHTSNWLQVKGLSSTRDIIYAMAFDENGTLYAIGADAGDTGGPASLYTITLGEQDATANKVGEIKTSSGSAISTNFAQDLDFDHASGTLYWAENNKNEVYTLNTESAAATYLGQVKYNNKAYALQSFCIPKDTALGQNDDQYMISVICEGAGTVISNNVDKAFYMVGKNDNLTLALTPDENGKLLSVKVDGQSVSVDNFTEYTFNNVTANHVIEVTFRDNLPVTQKNMTWFHYQGYEASFYTQHHAYKFYELPYTTDAPREGYTQTLLDENGQEISNDTVILAGNYDVRVTHPGTDKYNALGVVYEDALQLAKCPGTPGRPVVYGKVGCTQGDLATTSALQDYYGADGKLIDAAHDEIPVTLVWLNPETVYDTAGYFSASATIHAAQNLDQRLKDCYTLDDGSPLTEGCQISPRATQVVVLPEAEASLIKLQTSDASGGTVSGRGVYKNGTEVTVTAAVNANDGYEFKGWQENGQIVSGAGETYTFEADGDRTLTALFEVSDDYRVTLQTDPADAGTVTGGGSYEEGDHRTTVKAAPNQGYYFIGWYDGDAQKSADSEYAFAVEEEGITLTAKFGIDYLARAEQARTNFESALGTDAFEWQTLVQAVDAYEAAADFVENPPSVIEDAQNRYDALTTYYNGILALDLSDQDIGNDDLAELAIFTGVTDLNLGGNKGIADLSALKELAELETLDISGTGVTALNSLVTENSSNFPGCQNLTANNLTLNSISALAQLVSAEGFAADSVNKWDFTGSTLPDTEGSETDVEAIQTALGDKFTPPTIRTTPAPAPTPAEHAIVVAETEHGKVTAEPAKAAEGVSVTVTVTPDEGYKLETLTVTDANGAKLELTDKGDGRFEFSMPDCDVSVGAAFVPLRPDYASCRGGTDCPVSAFPDADPTEWYHDGIHFCLGNGMIGGYDNGLMGPHDSLSRAMMVRILFNYEGHPEVSESAAFDDVPDGTWYTDAVNWAAQNGVVEGYGDGRYGPADPITREQLATILYRYAQAKGFDTSVGEETNVLSYSDAGEISEFAMPAMQWACGSGVVEGYDGALRPQGGATRAEAATMLMRFCELYG